MPDSQNYTSHPQQPYQPPLPQGQPHTPMPPTYSVSPSASAPDVYQAPTMPPVQTIQQSVQHAPPAPPATPPFQAAPPHEQHPHNKPPRAAKEPKDKKLSSRLAPFVFGIVGVLVGALLSATVLFFVTSGFQPSTTISTTGDQITITPLPEDASLSEAVAAKVSPSIVNIDVYTSASSMGPALDPNSDTSSNMEQYGLGSGIIISEDGYILTNYHVLEGGDRFLVGINGIDQVEALLVGSDPESDLAVLKVEMTGLTPIEIGDSSAVSVGEWVMAVGSPFGLERSVSTGVVSALYRSTALESTTGVNIYANMIQTDAAINPGNSGGALVNSEGHLLGITTLINSTSGSNSGVGFAIPINYAMNVAEQIMDGKTVEHAFLGVTLQTVTSHTAAQLGVDVDSGAYIETIEAGSPAASAGIQEGDVVVAFNGKPVDSATELVIHVRGELAGSEVTIKLIRDGQTMELTVVLGTDA